MEILNDFRAIRKTCDNSKEKVINLVALLAKENPELSELGSAADDIDLGLLQDSNNIGSLRTSCSCITYKSSYTDEMEIALRFIRSVENLSEGFISILSDLLFVSSFVML